jgi:thiosulfate/3-mercaptopyruvate sulfurtransferase
MEEHMSSYAHPETVVNAQWVADHGLDTNVRLIEVGFDLAAYHSGHIPGAMGWEWSKDVLHPLRRDLPDKALLEARLSGAGIANNSTVVPYDSLSNLLAAFTFWMLKVYGHHDVRLLDGGSKKWLAEGRPVTTETISHPATLYKASNPDWTLRAHRDLLLDFIDKPDRVLVDLRPADMYRGDNLFDLPAGGHIPGAVNVPAEIVVEKDIFKEWLTPTTNDDGTFKPFKELRALFSGKGITADKEVITYCVRGGLSSHAWFVLKYLLGYPLVREYDGSWAEWSNLIGAPIAV